MQITPIDLTELVAVVLGISVVLIPVIGVTARFALKPTVEALSKVFESKGVDDTVNILERRMALQEQQIEVLESTVHRLSEVNEFREQLGAGPTGQSGPDAS